jgi:voltage-gated potassium channel
MTAAPGLSEGRERRTMRGLKRLVVRTRRWGRATRRAPRFAVVAGIAAVILMSEPTVRLVALPELRAALIACWAVFAVEWWMRLKAARSGGAAVAYLRSGMGIIDTLGVVGVPAAFLFGASEPNAWLLGAVWLLKPAARSSGLTRLVRVFHREAAPLAAVGMLFLVTMLVTAAMLQVAEGAAQPEAFGSLPRTLWWEILAMTNSHEDSAPATLVGRFATALLAFAFLGALGLWTCLMASGFVTESQRENFLRNWDLIARVPLFRSLGPAAISEVANALRPWEAPEQTVVFREGRPGDSMYFIVSGSVRVHTRPEPVVLTDGSFFGEMALLGDGLRSATISTVEPSSFLVLDVADFRKIMASNPELAATIDAESLRRREERQRAVHG